MQPIVDRRIVLNGRFLQRRHRSGVDYFAAELMGLIDVDVAVPPRWLSGAGLGDLWEQLFLPVRSRGCVLLSPCNTGPVLKRRQLLVLHDAAVYRCPKAFTRAFVLKSRILNRVLARRVAVLATVSDSSVADLKECLRLNRDVLVIPNVVERRRPTSEPSPKVKALLDQEYLLTVSNIDPRKNLHGLVRAWERCRSRSLGTRLVVVGGGASSVFRGVPLDRVEGVAALGRLSDSDVAHLFDHALGVVSVSHYEGYGRVAVEAALHGKPSVVSSIPAHLELDLPGAIYVDPADLREISDAIDQLAEAKSRSALPLRAPVERADVRATLDRALAVAQMWTPAQQGRR